MNHEEDEDDELFYPEDGTLLDARAMDKDVLMLVFAVGVVVLMLWYVGELMYISVYGKDGWMLDAPSNKDEL